MNKTNYCRFCGARIEWVETGWGALDPTNDWCQHWPEGERKLN